MITNILIYFWLLFGWYSFLFIPYYLLHLKLWSKISHKKTPHSKSSLESKFEAHTHHTSPHHTTPLCITSTQNNCNAKSHNTCTHMWEMHVYRGPTVHKQHMLFPAFLSDFVDLLGKHMWEMHVYRGPTVHKQHMLFPAFLCNFVDLLGKHMWEMHVYRGPTVHKQHMLFPAFLCNFVDLLGKHMCAHTHAHTHACTHTHTQREKSRSLWHHSLTFLYQTGVCRYYRTQMNSLIGKSYQRLQMQGGLTVSTQGSTFIAHH